MYCLVDTVVFVGFVHIMCSCFDRVDIMMCICTRMLTLFLLFVISMMYTGTLTIKRDRYLALMGLQWGYDMHSVCVYEQ